MSATGSKIKICDGCPRTIVNEPICKRCKDEKKKQQSEQKTLKAVSLDLMFSPLLQLAR